MRLELSDYVARVTGCGIELDKVQVSVLPPRLEVRQPNIICSDQSVLRFKSIRGQLGVSFFPHQINIHTLDFLEGQVIGWGRNSPLYKIIDNVTEPGGADAYFKVRVRKILIRNSQLSDTLESDRSLVFTNIDLQILPSEHKTTLDILKSKFAVDEKELGDLSGRLVFETGLPIEAALNLKKSKGEVHAIGHIKRRDLDFVVDFNGQPKDFGFESDIQLTGRGHLGGSLDSPRVVLQSVSGVHSAFEFSNRSPVNITTDSMQTDLIGTVHPLKTSTFELFSTPFEMNLNGPLLSPRFLVSFPLKLYAKGTEFSGLFSLSGQYQEDLAAQGEFSAGKLSISASKFEIENISGAVGITNKQLSMQRIDYENKFGKFNLSGELNFDNPNAFVPILQIERLQVEPFENTKLDLIGKVKLENLGSAPKLRGMLEIQQAEFRKEFGLREALKLLSKLIIPISGREVTEEASAIKLPEVELDLDFVAPRNLNLETNYAAAEFGGSLKVTGDTSSPMIEGQLRALKGWFGYKSQVFQITKASVKFVSGVAEPTLDLVAQSLIRQPDQQRVLVILEAQGNLNEPRIKLSSDSGLAESELLKLVASGAALPADQLSQLLQGKVLGTDLLAGTGGVGRFINKLTSLDSLDFEPGYSETSGTIEPKILAEKRLSENFGLLYEGTLGATQRQSKVQLLYKLAPRLGLYGYLDSLSTQKETSLGFDFKYALLSDESEVEDKQLAALLIDESVYQRSTDTQIASISIEGNRKVSNRIIENALGLKVGDLWDQRIDQAQNRVLQLGLFSSVLLRPRDGSIDSSYEDLVVSVVERQLDIMDIGAGLDSVNGVHLFFDGRDKSFFADGRLIGYRLDGFYNPSSSRLEKGIASLRFVYPDAFGSEYRLAENFRVERLKQSNQEFDIDRAALDSSIFREFDSTWSLTFGHTLSHETLRNVKRDVILSSEDVGTNNLSYISGSIIYDKRDDRLNPRKGFLVGIDYKLSSGLFGSTADFVGVGAKASGIIPLGGRFVFLDALRGGDIYTFGATDSVPLSQRYYLGGANTVRGFAENSLGPRGGEGSVLGGDLFVSNSSELRYLVGDNFALLGFFDLGGLYLKDRGFDLGELERSTGLGVRYLSPIGPIGLDVAHPLNREEGQSSIRLHFSIGTNF